MKEIKLFSPSALLCLLISSSVLALAPAPRLCRQMCGRPPAFRQSPGVVFGLRPIGAKPLTSLTLDGSAKRFRTSDGKAEQLSVDLLTETGTFQSVPSVEQFWAKFKAAVQKADKRSVASMSQFPIEMPYGVPKIRTRTQLARRWRDLFNVQADAAKCFEDAKPVLEREGLSVGCKDAAGNEVVVYGFVSTKMGWRLKYLDNINE